MTATVVLGYAKVGIKRRREERLLRHLDRAVHVTVADHGPRAQLLGNQLEVSFDILPLQCAAAVNTAANCASDSGIGLEDMDGVPCM